MSQSKRAKGSCKIKMENVAYMAIREVLLPHACSLAGFEAWLSQAYLLEWEIAGDERGCIQRSMYQRKRNYQQIDFR